LAFVSDEVETIAPGFPDEEERERKMRSMIKRVLNG